MSIQRPPKNNLTDGKGAISSEWLYWLQTVADAVGSSTASLTTSTTSTSSTVSADDDEDLAVTAGTDLRLLTFGGIVLSEEGIYIDPTSASGGGGYLNENAVRWTSDTTYRTAIWRSDDTSGTPVKTWNFDHISDVDSLITKAYFTNTQNYLSSTYTTSQLAMRSLQATSAQFMLYSTVYNGISPWQCGIHSYAAVGVPFIEMGVGTFNEFTDYAVSITGGIQCYSSGVICLGGNFEMPAATGKPIAYAQRYSDYQLGLGLNLRYASSLGQFFLDDTAESGWAARMLTTTQGDKFELLRASAGANPRSPSTVFSIDSSGNVIIPSGCALYSASVATANLRFYVDATLAVVRIGAAGTFILQGSTGSALFSIDASGTLSLTSSTAGSATAGTGTALPATPEGYVVITIGGTNRKIPYYRT